MNRKPARQQTTAEREWMNARVRRLTSALENQENAN